MEKSGGSQWPEKIGYLEALRILAVILVIFNHTDGFFLYFTNTHNPLTYFWSLFLSVLCRVNVPLFFMISGALLLEKQESVSKLYKKRVARFVIVIIVFSFLQYVVDVLRGRIKEVSPVLFLQGILEGNIEETYWFLYAYLGMLLLLPLLRRLAVIMEERDFYYLFFLEGVFGVGIPVLFLMTGMELPSGLFILPANIFYMLTGYWLAKHGLKRVDRKAFRGSCFILILLIGLGSLIVRMHAVMNQGVYSQRDLDCLTPLLAVAVFRVVQCGSSLFPWKENFRGVVLLAGSCSFGIYLIEQLIRILLLPVYRYLTEHSFGIVACSVYVSGTYLIGFGIVCIMKKIPVLRKLL